MQRNPILIPYRTIVAVVLALIALWVAGVLPPSRLFPPEPPVFEGRSLRDWQRAHMSGKVSSDELIRVLKSLGPDAIPWLTWAVEYGDEDKERSRTQTFKLGRLQEFWFSITGKLFPKKLDAYDERGCAIWALRYVGQGAESAIPALSRCLDDRDDPTAFEAGETLNRLHPDSLPTLVEASKSVSVRRRRNALRSLSMTNYRSRPRYTDEDKKLVLETLSRAVDDPDTKVRLSAAINLGNCFHHLASSEIPFIVEKLVATISDPDPTVCAAGCGALRRFKSYAAGIVPSVLPLLSSSDAMVRARAAELLGDIDQEEQHSRKSLILMTQDPDFDCRVAAAAALGDFGIRSEIVINELLVRLKSPDAETRSVTIVKLLEIGPIAADTMPSILEALKLPRGTSGNPHILVSRFTEFGHEVCVPHLVQALGHPNASVRAGAASVFQGSLYDTKNADVLPALRSLAEGDTDQQVRLSAQKAIDRMTEKH